jgi:hypothetical protein
MRNQLHCCHVPLLLYPVRAHWLMMLQPTSMNTLLLHRPSLQHRTTAIHRATSGWLLDPAGS